MDFVCQRFAFDVFHDQVRLFATNRANVVDRDDVRVVEFGSQFALTLKALY
jgi:hypothetical protein